MKDLFCKIINKEISSKIIAENNKFMAFLDINSITDGHFLVVPKKHSVNLMDIDSETLLELILFSTNVAKQEIKRLNKKGYKLQVNNSKEAGQEIFHTHIHIIPY